MKPAKPRVLDLTRLPACVSLSLPKGTGADYLLHPVDAPDGDRYERLECSGLGEGDERADTRLREKVRQLARFPDGPPGWAAVTDFRDLPIALHLGRWEASQ